MPTDLDTAVNSPVPLVACRDISLVFPGPVPALSRVNLTLQRGELVSIVGPSGCGKSTLLRLIARLITPTSGELEVAPQSLATGAAIPTEIGFVFQDANLLPWRTVSENIRLPLELLKVSATEHQERIQRSLDLVGLRDFARALPAQLSGGMRMRVSLARALVTRPQLMLLDEPFGALDEITRQRLNEDLLDVWRNQRWAGLFITHNVFEAVFLSQRVIVMSTRPGRVIQEFVIPFEFPRVPDLRGTPEFARLAAEISLSLRKGAA